jgi:hypothetical protein
MNVRKTAIAALISFAGLAIPTAGAAHADGNEPLLCGLLAPCDPGSTDDTSHDNGGAEPAAVDVDIDLDLDLGVDLATPDHDTDFHTDLDTHVSADLTTDAGIQLFPSRGTVLTADADVPSAAIQTNVLGHTADAAVDATLDTDAMVGQGVVLRANGAAGARAGVTAAGTRLVSADAANRLCGVQVVIAATSSADCRASASSGWPRSSDGDGLVAVTEALDVCGAHVVIAGSATTDCGGSSANGSPGVGSSWTLANAAISGSLCGLSVAVVGESGTSCSGTAQEAPVPGSGPNRPGTGTPGTGTSPSESDTSGGGGAAASPAAQPQQVAGASGSVEGDSNGSLPLTGTSLLIVLMIASASLVAGLVAVRSSRVGFGHQS